MTAKVHRIDRENRSTLEGSFIKWYNLMIDCNKLNMNIINLRETTGKVRVQLISYEKR